MTSTESKWAERVRDWKASGCSAPEYAMGRGFAPATLLWWSSHLGSRSSARSVAARTKREPRVRMARVIPVSKPDAGPLTVRVGGVAVEVRAGFDGGLLRAVVQALGGAT